MYYPTYALAATTAALLSCAVAASAAAPSPSDKPVKPSATYPLENLGRGLVALRQKDGSVQVSWRLLANDPANIAFNLYRSTGAGGPVRVNVAPLAGSTWLVDKEARPGSITYTVRTVIDGREGPPSSPFTVTAAAPTGGYLEVPLKKPADGKTPDGKDYSYSAGDGSIADLDGDGEPEFIVSWSPSNSKDNSHAGYSGNFLIDAYTLSGRQLWRIDLGRNIRAGAHYTQFIVFDFDGDGRAELACKTSDGTVDGAGTVIGDASADHRNAGGYILKGPEFLTMFDGRTGKALDTVRYVPARHPDTENPTGDQLKAVWGDNYGNRCDRFVAGVAALDGMRPSLLMCRGYYTRTVLAAWDFKDGKFSQRWVFDSAAGPESNRAYAGQGNHQLSVADVDADGRDEIIYGAMTLDDDGTGLYTTRLHHGDALHVSDLDPTRPGLESWSPHESPRANGGIGASFRDARTGKVLWSTPGNNDVGRGVAFDIDPRHPGAECWAVNSGKLYNSKGEAISEKRPGPCNFGIWWDGDAQRELLDRNFINKWVPESSSEKRLLTAEGCSWNNGTKANPVVSADIFGDWREEVVWRTNESSALRIYVTPFPTQYRLTTLLHDRQYRFAIAWQNVAYNQPPHPSFDLQAKLEGSKK